ncbi:MAG: hypothetical protein ACRD99_01810 [Nitrososphaera sp.]
MQSGYRLSFREKMREWSLRNQKTLIALNIFSLVLLFVAFLLTYAIHLYPGELLILLHLATFASAGFVVLSLASKGPIPLVIAIVGIVLAYNAIVSPLYATSEEGQTILGRQRIESVPNTGESLQVDRPTHFFLGLSMVVFGTIIAHKPSMLFTRNRPPPLDDEWSGYPIWQDNSILADGRTEQVVPVKNMMTEEDLRLLWRYEYVVATIYGSVHLVKPEGMVPKDSTFLARDKASGRILGKPRFTGFFI